MNNSGESILKMKLDKPINPNYCATVVYLPAVRFDLKDLDNLKGVSIFGYNVIVSKDTPSELGIFFSTETQLSDEYCYENNLYREESRIGNLNKDKSSKGYLDKNRRIRAIKFKGNVSNGLFMPLKSLEYTGIDTSLLKEGDEFDILNGKEICRKYEVPKKEGRKQEIVDRGFVRADKKFIPEHIDTENFFKNWDKIPPETEVIITQKLHGTSIRIAHTYVNYKPKLVDRVARFFGAKIKQYEYAYLYGSRKVIKDANNPNQNHYYEQDIWTNEGKKLDGLLPENYVVYGELVGWTPEGQPLQKGYTYGIPKGTCELYIYRITIINEKGLMTDLSWQAVKEFCSKNGLKYVPELFKIDMRMLCDSDFQMVKALLDTRYFDGNENSHFRNCLWLGEDKELVDEGICIRADGLLPKILKAKSPKFLEHETKILDTGEEDLESSQNV